MTKMTTQQAVLAGRALAHRIAAREPDTARWMLEVRKAAEALRLDVTRTIVLGQTLQVTCCELASEAMKQGRSLGEVEAA